MGNITRTEQEILNATYDEATGAAEVTLVTGLNKTDDGVTAYIKGVNASVISKTTAVTIGGGVANDTKLVGLIITTALTGTCVIAGLADSDGAAQSITLPVGSVGEKNFYRAKNVAGALTVTCSNASDDNLVVVLWEVNTDAE
jgi:hypothetical protein